MQVPASRLARRILFAISIFYLLSLAAPASAFFIPQPQPSPGNTPSKDKLRIRLQPFRALPDDPPAQPLFLTQRTADMIRSIWN